MNKSKKMLSAFIAFVMLISTMAVGFHAFADDAVETADNAVSDAEEKVNTFSENATYLFIISNAEKHEAAVAAYNDAVSAIKALSEEQKLQMDVALYGYMLNYVAESVGRDADQGTS